MLNGRYRIADRLGRGGMGSVWRAHDELLGREVAVKEILLPDGLDENALASLRSRALAEARAAARVRHPGVVTIHDVVLEDGHPWIVMELVRARSLDDRIRAEGALPVAETARIGAALADALRAVHARGIVHRDLKPGNVLLDEDDQVVLTDFGIATIEGDLRLTASGLLIGTPGFMAPERLAGEPAGPLSDLWCLGAVLYSAVEGRRPFEGTTPAMVASAVLTGAPAPQTRSGPLEPLITALLDRTPEARPDASETVRRLKAVHPDAEPRNDDRARTRADAAMPRPDAPTVPDEPRPTAAADRQIGAVPGWMRVDRTQPPAESSRRLRKPSTGCLVALAAAAALAAGVWAVWPTAHGDNGDSPESPGSTVDPCDLVSAVQLRSLGLAADVVSGLPSDGPSSTASCGWASRPGETPGVTIEVTRYAGPLVAADAFRTEQRPVSSTAFTPKGVGEQAFGYTAAEDDHRVSVTMRFQRGPRIVSVVVNKAPRTDAALQVAKWVDTGVQKYS